MCIFLKKPPKYWVTDFWKRNVCINKCIAHICRIFDKFWRLRRRGRRGKDSLRIICLVGWFLRWFTATLCLCPFTCCVTCERWFETMFFPHALQKRILSSVVNTSLNLLTYCLNVRHYYSLLCPFWTITYLTTSQTVVVP